ncbi:Acetyltransferase [Sulfitobacter noctilucicola]|uniref:RimJ/RimL family protein N-acetyltransferase n=1 Tax=Sulfitobacter noctilucicola TaxID=1342301 RepID=A0A7W6M4H5_9RHOB|nr:GNAT family N-acetyltransferase [Sulfitobacter noctilucicola]KIN63218.1 Acetyltransferase [Sulfitobacter noctilucicola]MBB4172256.1 RimJ/RimL family protein N-acetyltransferase [Sulfitobacter noctilucicola]
MLSAFNPQPTLHGPTLSLRALTEADREPLFSAASDPAIWAGHPAKDRHIRTVFDPYFDTLLASKSTLSVTHKGTGGMIGCSRYYTAPNAPDSISIGYTFLTRPYWGGDTNHQMKALMLAHAFEHVDRVWLHIDPTNIRSQRATAKLGATLTEEGPLTLGGKQGIWQSWCLSRADWQKAINARLN